MYAWSSSGLPTDLTVISNGPTFSRIESYVASENVKCAQSSAVSGRGVPSEVSVMHARNNRTAYCCAMSRWSVRSSLSPEILLSIKKTRIAEQICFVPNVVAVASSSPSMASKTSTAESRVSSASDEGWPLLVCSHSAK